MILPPVSLRKRSGLLENLDPAAADDEISAKLEKAPPHGCTKPGAAAGDQNALPLQQTVLKHVTSSLMIDALVIKVPQLQQLIKGTGVPDERDMNAACRLHSWWRRHPAIGGRREQAENRLWRATSAGRDTSSSRRFEA